MRIARGFTLVEMLVSMAAGTLLLLLALSALGAGGAGYRRSSGDLSAGREARAALDLIGRDLAKVPGSPLLRTESTGGPGRWGLVLEQAPDGALWRRDRLGFLCLQPGEVQERDERAGDVCAVTYYLADQQMSGRAVRCLMRGLRPSAEVFDALRDGNVGSLHQAREGDEPVAFGIVSFAVEPLLREDSEGLTAGSRNAGSGARPELVRLRLVVARPELIGKLEQSADWDAHPLLASPAQAEQSRWLEVYQILARFGHDG